APLASSSTLAIASPALMPVTRAGIWFRALSCMFCFFPTWSTVSRRSRYRHGLPAQRELGHEQRVTGGPPWAPAGRLATPDPVARGGRAAPPPPTPTTSGGPSAAPPPRAP